MTQLSNPFATVVKLYRELGRPPIVDDRIVYDGPLSEEIIACVETCKNLNEKYGRLDDADINGGMIEIDFMLPSGTVGFHKSFESFIVSTPTLSKGKLPESFYIIDEDWSPTDTTTNKKFEQITLCCDLVNNLCKLALVADRSSSGSHENLFFSLPGDKEKKPKTFVLETKLDASILNTKIRHTKLVKSLADDKNEGKLHLEERKLFFWTAVADVLESAGEKERTFTYVLRNWENVLQKYWQNLQTYVHGFSFDKLRGELAKAELEFGTKLSTALGDLAGKLLALPVSLGGLVLLNKAESKTEIYATASGIVMASIIFCTLLANQWLNIQRINNAFNITFGEFKKKLDTYPRKIQDLLRNTDKEITKQRRFLKFTIGLFFFLAMTPSIGVFILAYSRWPDKIIELLNATMDFISNKIANIL